MTNNGGKKPTAKKAKVNKMVTKELSKLGTSKKTVKANKNAAVAAKKTAQKNAVNKALGIKKKYK